MNTLANLREMLAYIDRKTDGVEIKADDRNAVAGALYDVSLEHAKAICALFENHHYPTAFATIRVLFETFIRASWVLYCASDQEVQTFIKKDKIEVKGKGQIYFGDMIKAVEKEKDWPDTLSDIKKRSWNALNSYTHGGQFQVTRRYNGVTIEPHHEDELAEETCQFTAIIAFLTFGEFANLSENLALHQCTEELYGKVSPWCFNNQKQADV